jgi:type IV secretory pathway VirB10-like protein
MPNNGVAMKRIEFMLAMVAVVVAFAMGAAAQSESVGDRARAMRKEKRPPAKKVYTNDNLPTSASISVVGPLAQANPDEKAAAKPQDESEKQVQKETKTEDKAEEKNAPEDEQGWRDRFSEQKRKISDLGRELDVLQREYQLLITNYYADAGSKLRDEKKWADEDARYRTEIADKQKQIEEAQAQLQDMAEQARQAGMPSSVSE